MQVEFKISDWQAIAPGVSSVEDWLLWASSGQRTTEVLPAFDLIPASLRRRMSLPSKLAVHIALSLASRHQLDYAIFVSRHGELQRTCQLLDEILSGAEASPTAFSQSVHNTAAGLFTIAAHSNLPVTSLAACEDSFCQGMLEAFARIKQPTRDKLLLVCFDELVPDAYKPYAAEEVFPYALGLILEHGADWSLATSGSTAASLGARVPQALEFLMHYLNKDREFVISGKRHDWFWAWTR
jgi:hypothetical protein